MSGRSVEAAAAPTIPNGRLAMNPHRPGSPAYYLGRPAETWRVALRPPGRRRNERAERMRQAHGAPD
jgi:hypothetical protein